MQQQGLQHQKKKKNISLQKPLIKQFFRDRDAVSFCNYCIINRSAAPSVNKLPNLVQSNLTREAKNSSVHSPERLSAPVVLMVPVNPKKNEKERLSSEWVRRTWRKASQNTSKMFVILSNNDILSWRAKGC